MSRALDSFKLCFRRTNRPLWLSMVAVSVYGLLLVASVTRVFSVDCFKTQLIAVILEYIAAIVLTRLGYREITNYWYLVAGFCIFLIIYMLLFGQPASGSSGIDTKAWIKLPGGTTFQPPKLAKIDFMITFPRHPSVLEKRGLLKDPLYVVIPGVHVLIPMLLTHVQDDDGAAVIFLCMFLAMSFTADVQLRYFALVFGAMLIGTPLAWKYVLADYQKTCLINMMNPKADPLGVGLQQIQDRISIGSGQMFGRGLFGDPRVARNGISIQQSDFIFSVAGEKLGFIGTSLTLILILVLLITVLYCVRKANDPMGAYMCFGFFGIIASQAIFNVGMCLSLLPVMGVTLPFFSMGNSSAVCFYLGFGLVQSTYMFKHDTDKVQLWL